MRDIQTQKIAREFEDHERFMRGESDEYDDNDEAFEKNREKERRIYEQF